MRTLQPILLSLLLLGVLGSWVWAQGNGKSGETKPEAAASASTDKAESAPAAENAAAPAQPKTASASKFEEFMDKLKKGGRIIVVLLVLSVSGLAFVFERVFRLRKKIIVPEGLAEQAAALWEQKDFAALRELCRKHKSVLGMVIENIINHRNNKIERVQRFAEELGERELRLHLRRAYPLAVVATIAPLLGLLGTIVGMIGAFDTVAVAGSMGDPSLLADDISKALVTTAAGLIVAIPALCFYHYFKSRTNYFSIVLESQVSDLISLWFMDGADDEGVAETAPADVPQEV